MALRTLSPVNSLFTGSVSMIANLILLLLIYGRTSKELRVYSRILIQNCVVDMCYTATVLLTEAQIEFSNGATLMMMAGVFRHTPHPYNYNLINLYIVGLFSCVLFLPIQFVFRYYIVCHNKVLSTRKYALMCCTSLFVAVAYTCLHAWTFMPRGNLQAYAYIVDTPFWIDDTGKPPVFIAADIKDLRIVILVTACMVLSSLAYAVILVANSCVLRKLKHHQHQMSRGTREVQKQLGRVLRYQAIVPLLVCVVPLALVFVFGVFGVKTCGWGLMLTILVAWIPVLNPLSTIIFVRQYRSALLRCGRRNDTMPSYVTSSMMPSSVVFHSMMRTEASSHPRPVDQIFADPGVIV
ncbi:Protein Y9C9A.5 [Aphelenchoides avenae]|nr:Protein Y9C9A.5 [Aphelenchus avenae]